MCLLLSYPSWRLLWIFFHLLISLSWLSSPQSFFLQDNILIVLTWFLLWQLIDGYAILPFHSTPLYSILIYIDTMVFTLITHQWDLITIIDVHLIFSISASIFYLPLQSCLSVQFVDTVDPHIGKQLILTISSLSMYLPALAAHGQLPILSSSLITPPISIYAFSFVNTIELALTTHWWHLLITDSMTTIKYHNIILDSITCDVLQSVIYLIVMHCSGQNLAVLCII